MPWLSSDTKSLMTLRDRLLTAAKSTNLKKDWDEFRKARNKVTSKLRADKEYWEKKSLKNCQNDSGKLWKNVLGWLNWSKSGPPTRLYSNGTMERSPKVLANIMNNFYVCRAPVQLGWRVLEWQREMRSVAIGW